MVDYMRHSSNLAYGMKVLEEILKVGNPYGAPSNVVLLVKILAQASAPRLRGTPGSLAAPYNRLLQYLNGYCMLRQTTTDVAQFPARNSNKFGFQEHGPTTAPLNLAISFPRLRINY